MKRRAIAIILSILFIAAAVFGVFTMGFMTMESTHNCPKALSGEDCLLADGVLASLEHHVSALGEFTTATIVPLLLIALLGAVGLFSVKPFAGVSGGKLFFARQKYQQLFAELLTSFRQILRWIVLHNTRGIPVHF